MADQELNFRVSATNDGKAAMKGAEGDLKAYGKALKKLDNEAGVFTTKSEKMVFQMKKMGERARSLGKRFSKVTDKIFNLKTGMMGMAAVAGAQMLKGAIDDAAAFEGKLASLGPNVEATEARILKVQAATEGMFSLESIVEAEAKMKALGVGLKMTPEVLKNIALKASAMGITTERALDSVATGTARQSNKWLDNLGIIIKIGEANEIYSQSLGKLAKDLTESEKKLAFTAAVQRELNKASGEMPAALKASMQMNAKMADALLRLKQMAIELVPVFMLVIDALEKMVAVASWAFKEVGKVVNFTVDAVKDIGGALDWATFGVLSERGISNALARVTIEARKAAGVFELVEDASVKLRNEEDELINTWELGGLVLRGFIGAERSLNVEMRIAAIHAKRADEEFERLNLTWRASHGPMNAMLVDLFEVGKTVDWLSDMLERFMSGKGEFKKDTFKQATRAEIAFAKQVGEEQIKLAEIVDKRDKKLQGFKIKRMEIERQLSSERNKVKRVELETQLKLLDIEERRLKLALTWEPGKGAEAAIAEAQRVAGEAGKVEALGVTGPLRKEAARTDDPLRKKMIGFQLQEMVLNARIKDEVIGSKKMELQLDLELLKIAKERAGEEAKKGDEAKRYYDFAAALGESSTAMGSLNQDMGKAMAMTSGLASLVGDVTKGEKSQTEAIYEGIGVMGTGVAEFIEGERAKAGILSLMEFARAAMSWPNFGAMAAHTSAAIMFGAIAGGAGGGGAAAKPGGADERDQAAKDKQGGGKGSQAQIVVNYNSGIVMGGRQTIGRAIADASRSVSKTGQMSSAF